MLPLVWGAGATLSATTPSQPNCLVRAFRKAGVATTEGICESNPAPPPPTENVTVAPAKRRRVKTAPEESTT